METATAAELLGRRIGQLRQDRGWSLTDLAGRMRDVGVKLHKSTMHLVEKGERRVPIDEVLKFAYVLDCAPVHLFVPPDEYVDTLQVQVTDEVAVGPYALRKWVRGEVALSGQDERWFLVNTPAREWTQQRGKRRDRLVTVAEEVRHAIIDLDRPEAFNGLVEVTHLAYILWKELGYDGRPWDAWESPGRDEED